MGIISLTFRKLKAFRMTIPSLILLALASFRSLTSGESIQLVGICASVVPFICQFKNFPREEDASPFRDALSSYLMNLILMVIYLGYMLLLKALGSALIPAYVHNPHYWEMLMMALCANVVFISALVPICRDLQPKQRLMPGIILCNAQLVFMMMAADYVKSAPENLMVICGGFIGLILLLTLGFLSMAYRETPKKV